MYYNNYLIHVNNNHMPSGSKKGGQFAPGDGDNDGIIDDHAHRSKKEIRRDRKLRANAKIDKAYMYLTTKQKPNQPKSQEDANKQILIRAGMGIAGFAFSKTKVGRTYAQLLKESDLKAAMKDSQLEHIMTNTKNIAVEKISDAIP